MWPAAPTRWWATAAAPAAFYDKIGYTATAKVKYVLANAVVCKVKVPLGAEPAEDGEEDISF